MSLNKGWVKEGMSETSSMNSKQVLWARLGRDLLPFLYSIIPTSCLQGVSPRQLLFGGFKPLCYRCNTWGKHLVISLFYGKGIWKLSFQDLKETILPSIRPRIQCPSNLTACAFCWKMPCERHNTEAILAGVSSDSPPSSSLLGCSVVKCAELYVASLFGILF